MTGGNSILAVLWGFDATLRRCVGRPALSRNRPTILHSDQGVQYTNGEMASISLDADIKSSMNGRGRCCDNFLMERLWRSVNYEDVNLNLYATLHKARARLQAYFHLLQPSASASRPSAPHTVCGVLRPSRSRPDSAASMKVDAIRIGAAWLRSYPSSRRQ